MSIFAERSEETKRLMVVSAAAIYGGAAFVGLLEDALPGGPQFSVLPGLVALVFVVFLLGFGVRFPFPVLVALGPIGVAMIGYALATTEGPGDAAVLYMWPVLWVAYFFGRTGSVLVVAWIGVVHGLALASLPDAQGNLDRWLDVMVSVGVVAGVVHLLSQNNRRLVAELAAEARSDQLTGVLNRRGFDERMAIELDRARRDETSLGVASFDIDHFKQVNDDYGHEIGDRVLAHLGAVLVHETRATDVVARTGGEEFVVLLPGCAGSETLAFAERVRARFAEGGQLPPVTVSAGVSSAVCAAGRPTPDRGIRRRAVRSEARGTRPDGRGRRPRGPGRRADSGPSRVGSGRGNRPSSGWRADRPAPPTGGFRAQGDHAPRPPRGLSQRGKRARDRARARDHLQLRHLGAGDAVPGHPLHRDRSGPDRARRVGEAARRLLAGRLRERRARPDGRRSATRAPPSSATRSAAGS